MFAGEFSQSTLYLPDNQNAGRPGFIVTPSGAWCRLMLIAGALTEFSESGGMIRCRVADPTGVFNLVTGSRAGGLADALKDIPVPSFVIVQGVGQNYRNGSDIKLSVRPEIVREVDRKTRDQQVIVTAQETLSRLEQIRSCMNGTCDEERIRTVIDHYSTTPEKLAEIAGMVKNALITIRTPPGTSRDSEKVYELVMKIIRKGSGPRGIAVDGIIQQASTEGADREMVVSVLEMLIRNDECYQPQKGYVKLL